MTPTDRPPSARQLAYLKALAERAGQTFCHPRTAAHASREIARLRAAPSGRAERELERAGDPTVREAIEDAAVIRGFELVGYGSSCTWRRS
jgi:hypothetical protein